MNSITLAEVTNELQHIILYTNLLKENPKKYIQYSELIESSAYKIDALTQDLFLAEEKQTQTISPNNKTLMISNVLKGKNIMIIDDLKENRDILQRIFDTLKCNVECASSGEKALKLFKNFKPAIVCMDIVMPGMQGDETTNSLREAGCDASFIAVSAMKEYPKNKLLVFDAWLPKPFTIEQIFDLISSLDLYSDNILNTDEEEIILNNLSLLEKQAITDAIKRGAISELETVVNSLNETSSKKWLEEKVSLMEFEDILKYTIFA